MGCSSSSHIISSKPLSSRVSPESGYKRTKRRISSLFCGASSSKSTFQLEDQPEPLPITHSGNSDSQNSAVQTSPLFSSEVGTTSSLSENMDSSGRNSSNNEELILESGPVSVQRSSDHNDLPNSNEPRHQPRPRVSPSLHRFPTRGEHVDLPTISSPASRVSDSGDRDLRSGDLLLLDMVSISSNLLTSSITEINRRESRRNSRRLFWDALSRRNFRRLSDSSTIVFAAGLADELGSHDRWLVDFSGDLHFRAGHDIDLIGARYDGIGDRRRLLRAEISERTTGERNDGTQQTALCASGLHSEGSCLCDSFFTAEESSTLASISQIIMLADALFEVLDEIHNQSLSLSLSTLSLPAPESVIDAFPLKHYKRVNKVETDTSDAHQCHICLTDYEDGDKLRILPCNHEYHAPCVDKWLKEVNRVCPLCRKNVCEGTGECSVSNEEVSSL